MKNLETTKLSLSVRVVAARKSPFPIPLSRVFTFFVFGILETKEMLDDTVELGYNAWNIRRN